MKPTFTIAVRSLVEHLLRSGDLRFDFFRSVSAVEGIRAHQQVQRQRPAGYQPEVLVGHTAEHPDFYLSVSGRIDGVQVEGDRTIIEEIKTTRRSPEDLEQNPNSLHWGQAQCYAYLWALQEKIPSVVVRLTYVNADSGRIFEMERVLDTPTLAAFFNDLLERYMAWIAEISAWVKVRDGAIRQSAFPFDQYRSGQREMAVAVFRTIRDRGHLLVQAATGIGKTMAALFPAVKALGEKLTEKVVFLTARTTGRLAAESAIRKLMDQGVRLKSVSLTAKDKICFFPQSACSPDECQCARGYYDRINAALAEAMTRDAWTRDRIEQLALAHNVCPFEFSLELVNWADCVICDYNYAFAPGVILQRLFEEQSGRHAVLVDEAHNLVDRSREMFSAQLTKQTVLALRRQVKGELIRVYRALGRINAWMVAARRRCQEAGGALVESELPLELLERLTAFLRAAEKWLALDLRTPFRDALLEFFFEVLRFMRVSESFDVAYKVIYQADGGQALEIKLYCLDPSHQLQQGWQRCQSAVLFSATLAPAGYFQTILGCSPQAAMLNLPSPFPPDNLAVFVADRISTVYKDRGNSRQSVSLAIAHLVNQRQGHYLIYFPSYEYMLMVYEDFSTACDDVETLMQTPEMSDAERTRFLSRFDRQVSRTLVGFAVMGGIFGEGIDLKGERLTGAVIVGVGLPGICLERNLIQAYFDRVGDCGFEFAYQFPGINRVLQAAGRVIRSEEDRGAILLIDRRYGHHRYRALLPPHWDLQRMGDAALFKDRIRTFWEK